MGDTPIERQAVASSMAKTIGHDPDRNELHVEFPNGKVHIVEGVTAEEVSAALASGSFGKFYNANFRNRPSRPFSDIPDPSDPS